MNQKILWSIVVLVVILGIVFFIGRPSGGGAAAEKTVTDFGASLQSVSLLATSTAAAQIQSTYAPYVASNLLSAWEANPQTAPGRLTSSPWPDRIAIASVTKQSDGTYTVGGTVIEKTSTGDAGSYPVTAVVTNEGGSWLITSWTGYPPMVVPQTGAITVEGKMVCLPHTNSSGPQTLECAIGMQDDQGRYFALSDTNPAENQLGSLPSGTRVHIEGTFSPTSGTQYQEVGTISVTSVTKL